MASRAAKRACPFAWDRSRYIHFQLRPDPRHQITISDPSVGPPVRAPRRLDAVDFAGVYIDALNRAYVVESTSDQRGITVEGPAGDPMTFSTRVNDTFTGPSGRVAFTVVNHRVTGLSLTPNAISAKRLAERQ